MQAAELGELKMIKTNEKTYRSLTQDLMSFVECLAFVGSRLVNHVEVGSTVRRETNRRAPDLPCEDERMSPRPFVRFGRICDVWHLFHLFVLI